MIRVVENARVDSALLDAAETVLIQRGFDGISLERVADQAGRSRVTLWRQGITKDVLVTGLLQRLADDFQREFWPVLNGGHPAVLFCFVWLFFSAAGGGPWSLDASLRRKSSSASGARTS